MIETLITSKTRLKLLLKFFLNPALSSYLRELESEFQESSNGIRLELNRLEEANMLISNNRGNKKFFRVNTRHPLFNEIHQIVRKHYQLDVILDEVVKKLGNLQSVYLTGTISEGRDGDLLDLIFVGRLDRSYLLELTSTAENLLKRKIRYVVYEEEEFQEKRHNFEKAFLLWTKSSDK